MVRICEIIRNFAACKLCIKHKYGLWGASLGSVSYSIMLIYTLIT